MQRLGEGVVVVELHRAVERHGGLGWTMAGRAIAPAAAAAPRPLIRVLRFMGFPPFYGFEEVMAGGGGARQCDGEWCAANGRGPGRMTNGRRVAINPTTANAPLNTHPSMIPMHSIFVYGTLKRGFPNHGLMDGARFIGEAMTVERYPMVVQGRHFSPVIMPEPGSGHRIVGELWEVDDQMLVVLDDLEIDASADRLYSRDDQRRGGRADRTKTAAGKR